MIARSIFVSLAIGLVCIAISICASPKIRASAKLATLFTQQGIPWQATRAFYRLPMLTSVTIDNCEATGPRACYWADSSQHDASNSSYYNADDKGHMDAVADIFDNEDHMFDLNGHVQTILNEPLGSDFPDSINRSQLEILTGAAIRSVEDEELSVEEVAVVFDYMDENGDGELSVEETVGSLNVDCSSQLITHQALCYVYSGLASQVLDNGDYPLNLTAWVARMNYGLDEAANHYDAVEEKVNRYKALKKEKESVLSQVLEVYSQSNVDSGENSGESSGEGPGGESSEEGPVDEDEGAAAATS